MREFAYVLARVNVKGLEEPDGISFEHVMVTAEDEDEAYLKGQRAINPLAGENEIINDYVVELP